MDLPGKLGQSKRAKRGEGKEAGHGDHHQVSAPDFRPGKMEYLLQNPHRLVSRCRRKGGLTPQQYCYSSRYIMVPPAQKESTT